MRMVIVMEGRMEGGDNGWGRVIKDGATRQCGAGVVAWLTQQTKMRGKRSGAPTKGSGGGRESRAV